MVLMHGLGGSHLNWMRLGPRLAERARVYAPDMAGFGRTPPAARSTSVWANQRLLDRFLEVVTGAPAILVGNSMGGMISILEAAARAGPGGRTDPAVAGDPHRSRGATGASGDDVLRRPDGARPRRVVPPPPPGPARPGGDHPRELPGVLHGPQPDPRGGRGRPRGHGPVADRPAVDGRGCAPGLPVDDPADAAPPPLPPAAPVG
ncbi:MAG: alpha/beta fold hydrolase [Actinomycetota bacterium]